MYTLNWQPPYDWSWMLGFLAARAVSGVETVADNYYARSLAVGEYRGVVGISRRPCGERCGNGRGQLLCP
ncbi:3-methyladenine DNA glycosylase [Shigella sonnei]|nr:3-methyladenine DNA glycosylase [Shigella sonnei]